VCVRACACVRVLAFIYLVRSYVCVCIWWAKTAGEALEAAASVEAKHPKSAGDIILMIGSAYFELGQVRSQS
jgi:hypothetical protein